ncbi:MAG: flagellar filament capping protein FliD [Lachnospiraceae bacterium]|nr:flagellar filament capping protein FliD [Lachnospiraceae bacterium]
MAGNIMRMSGMVSGMDTESLVSALSSSYKTKVDKAKKAQTKLEWKQDAWKDMNTKIYGLYSGKLSSMRFTNAYNKKATKVSSNALTVTAGANAVDGVQTAKIMSMAKAAYLTGGEIKDLDGGKVTNDTKLTDLGLEVGSTITISSNGNSKEIEVTEDMTMFGLTSAFKEAGVNANFDEANGRLFVSAKETGAQNDFSFTASDSTALDKLGLSSAAGAIKIDGKDAELELNGATFKSTSNTFNINGSTYQINAMTDEEISVTTQADTSGIYDMIKDVLGQYNDVMKSMSSAYNAASTTYEPLTDEEKDALSDKQVEEWEKRVKDAVLRKDESLNKVMNAMKQAMAQSIEIDGKSYSLADFGITTAGYLNSDVNDRYNYHIDGDKDDAISAGKTDKLNSMIASDPKLVTEFFTKLSQNLYGAIDDEMKSTDYSSVYKVYDDKKMKKEYDDYTSKISKLEQQLQEAEDRYYKQFTQMEKLLSGMQSQTDAVSSLFNM